MRRASAYHLSPGGALALSQASCPRWPQGVCPGDKPEGPGFRKCSVNALPACSACPASCVLRASAGTSSSELRSARYRLGHPDKEDLISPFQSHFLPMVDSFLILTLGNTHDLILK